jgi:hypothetical protein
VKQHHELVLHSFETTTEATTADALFDIALFVQEQACHGLIVAEVHRRYYHNCHDLGVTQHALRVISVMLPFQQVVAQAVNEYNVGVHGVLRCLSWFVDL